MSDFPTNHLPSHRVIGTWSAESMGVVLPSLLVAAPNGGTNWAEVNRVIYVPLLLTHPFSLVRFWWANGTTLSGQIEVGLYSASGTRLATTGSIGGGVAAGTQSAAPTAGTIVLAPGFYRLAVTVNQINRRLLKFSSTVQNFRKLNVYEELTGGFGLPATATLGTNLSAWVPVFGISEHALI